ncbi:glycosyltransferase family 25 protein [Ancylothrix sp. C2]|uniref:glycosyltransferase family 25 protein n=1 Tax=Ancylothrix sp. D3o TaxID=2953691 RepID=UPI0021BAF2D1|nr:glycosyltransferase family 25 protein [Ancylothrix sp. D3o]MCT7952797.1 glycosyltransferase family 25 protein [Ancylothrix sp. D3o]
MDWTPFSEEHKNIFQNNNFAKHEILFTQQEEDCDVFVSIFFDKLKPFIIKYGSSKKYLVWTNEPRYDTHFEKKVFFKGVDVHIMNVYTGDTLWDNYYFFHLGKQPLTYYDNFERENYKKIATLITNRVWNTSLIRDGRELDLSRLRREIALQGYELGRVDIYGKKWPENIAIENSRAGDWHGRKLEILPKYHFNLCFENTIADYYCTEKIWDSIGCGCLPIYYGGKNSTIYEDFETNSFLDYTDFRNPHELFEYIEAMTIDEFNERLHRCIHTVNKIYDKVHQLDLRERVVIKIMEKLEDIMGGSLKLNGCKIIEHKENLTEGMSYGNIAESIKNDEKTINLTEKKTGPLTQVLEKDYLKSEELDENDIATALMRSQSKYNLIPRTVNDYFDKIFVINLSQNVQKWAVTSEMLSRYGIKFERVEAVNGYDEENVRSWKDYASKGLNHQHEQTRKRKLIESPGAWGCLLSHKKVIENAKQEGLEKILILEDDIMIHQDFFSLFSTTVQQFPLSWKLIYFGCVQVNWSAVKQFSPNLYHPSINIEPSDLPKVHGSFAYALHASIFDFVLEEISALDWAYDDGPLKEVENKFSQQTFACTPNLFIGDYNISTLRHPEPNMMEKVVQISRWELNNYEPRVYHPKLRVVALLTVRNEERYLASCLEHLHSQGIETCLIDNGSTDRTLEIAESFLERGVFRIEHLPFQGYFELEKILLNEEKLASEINADWFIHLDADEIREAPKPYISLLEGIQDADRQGYNAINFDEFVFIPTSDEEDFEGKDFVKEMQYYYFFEPYPLREVKAWKKTPNIDLHSSGGHRVEFAGQKIFPVSFILRHYIVLSQHHAIAKYGNRVFTEAELAKGWHGDRKKFSAENIKFSERERLKKIDNFSQWDWDKSEPWVKHEIFSYSDEGKSEAVESKILPVSNLHKIKADLERSRAKLSQIKALLKYN